MLSNYALYIKERENKDIIETEKGFATYYFDEDCIYVADVFVRPEFRRQHVAKDFFDVIEDIGREKGLKECVTYGDNTTLGYDITEKSLLNNGFELIGFTGKMVFFKRNL